MDWQQQAYDLLLSGKYDQMAKLYEQAIQTDTNNVSHYWHLGLAYLLQGQKEEAHVTWQKLMAQGTLDEIEQWTAELVQVLETEAQRQKLVANYQLTWVIRQHIREIVPAKINNLLDLIYLSIQLKTFVNSTLTDWGVVEVLEKTSPKTVDSKLLLQVLEMLLQLPQLPPELFDFAKACLPHVDPPDAFIDTLLPGSSRIAYIANQPDLASRLLELCLDLDPNHLKTLEVIATLYANIGRCKEAVEIAERYYTYCQTLPLKIMGNYLILRGLMGSGGRRQEVCSILERHHNLLLDFIQEQPKDIPINLTNNIIVSPSFFPYIQDNPQKNRWLQNKVAQICQNNLQSHASQQMQRYQKHLKVGLSSSSRPLRIGFISRSLRQHSVGWLSRWLFYYRNREDFHSLIYFIGQTIDGFTYHWFVNRANAVHNLHDSSREIIADKIFEDKIDILVDLDSVTSGQICGVMALKPAPVQVTWLGWDASGVPAIDYFIADPYVLPENAQEYYQETIWRLPQTYVAVDGFEVGVPKLRREQLGIPTDAIVYLSAQSGYKRHLDTARLQMKILKQVPNSYLLVKGPADIVAVQESFTQLAEAEGVAPGRLQFLPNVPTELEHRANLGIADVVLDTYPYHGATTTLETLWMCIPLVTRVGQQFSARNSYSFLRNVGVTEGIAWTDEEYIEWGVRLGKDETLRQKVAWQLKVSRQTSPLWNAEQFTREMEKAFQQMWAMHVEASQV